MRGLASRHPEQIHGFFFRLVHWRLGVDRKSLLMLRVLALGKKRFFSWLFSVHDSFLTGRTPGLQWTSPCLFQLLTVDCTVHAVEKQIVDVTIVVD